ncbi:hypothetical protein ONZ45_g16609 [Pleurotus djamor]|nr:hypothetical protein ONZ45_g16609 [Pleurotus djamor]
MAKQHRKDKSIWPSFNLLRENAFDRSRLAADMEAKLRSASIDRALEDERKQRSKEPKAKILLLGPSESGKSTLVKGFQMAFSPATFESQIRAWLPIIHLNLVRAFIAIIEALESLPAPCPSLANDTSEDADTMPDEIHELLTRLQKLRVIERQLEDDVRPSEPSSLLGSPTITRPSTPAPCSTSPAFPDQQQESTLRKRDISHRASEISLRSDILKQRLMEYHASDATTRTSYHHPSGLLSELSTDMSRLWEHPWVRRTLEDRDIHLAYQSGFFLDDIRRLTAPEYHPTAEDVLRSRVYTPSAEEHRLILEDQPSDGEKEWVIYDRLGRNISKMLLNVYDWIEVTVAIYVASLSAFNETLAEDPSINRLTDSLLLWQTLCSNKLLASVDFVLLLNKVDLLKIKLEGDLSYGRPAVRFVDFINSFKSRHNNAETVSAYIREMFLNLHRQHSPSTRKVHAHITCAIDPPNMRPVLDSIRHTVVSHMTSTMNLV